MDAEEYFERLARWLDLEAEAEIERLALRRQRQSAEYAERSGDTLLDLVVDDHEGGLGGRLLLTLVKRNRSLGLPWNRLRVGSPVIVTADEKHFTQPLHGVVSARNRRSIQVAVNGWPAADRLRLDLRPDEITRKRQLAAMREAQQVRGRIAQLRSIILLEREPQFSEPVELCIQANLNPSQREAVRFAMSAKDLAVIHGPPGTGKTTTVVELIQQAVARGERVLACAPSNTAVDNMLQRLVAAGASAVRIGHPARVAEELRPYTLDALVEDHELMRMAKSMYREADELRRKSERYSRATPATAARRQQREDARDLRREARALEQQVLDLILDDADVICATTTFDDALIGGDSFDLVVIDEAAQSTEPGCWIPLLRAGRVVLAGDHLQLPPTVLSKPAAAEGFETSLLERMVEAYGKTINRRLTVQYRMHEQIMRFSSDRFYDGELVADASVRDHRLVDLPEMLDEPLTREPVTFIDTAGKGWEEELEEEGESKFNPGEGEFVLRKVGELCDCGLPAKDIAVIAPYAAQVRWLRDRCELDELEIDTVDGFQGREKEAVVISLVRSNFTGEIGFLGDIRRMNVAMTRARRKLILIGDSATLAGHEFYNALLAYFESIGAYRSVWEEE
ncbi:IGHMBP2 family helicase [Candidatus Laterigemmans baculatus]|uniref:IGHMBP2 family helicase n=1 Tax=Candidatus Laterigemmans baculatus TaxID=2770505 RepID=UPI0013DC17D9|nr:IGHMBP2 family helicase [Candidatus Laterigemmans baculatus]